MQDNKWARLLAYVTGLVNQQLLIQNEYLAAENRILRAQLPKRLRLTGGTAVTLSPIASERPWPVVGARPHRSAGPSCTGSG